MSVWQSKKNGKWLYDLYEWAVRWNAPRIVVSGQEYDTQEDAEWAYAQRLALSKRKNWFIAEDPPVGAI